MAEGAGQGRPRYDGTAHLVRLGAGRQFRAGRRYRAPRSSKEYGPIAQASEYTGKIDGHWMAVPTSYGNGSLPPCARIDYMKEYVGLDVAEDVPGRRAARQGTGRDLDLGLFSSTPPRNASRAAIPSAWGSAPAPTRSIWPVRCSTATAPISSTPKAISRSRPTRPGRRWNFSSSSQIARRRSLRL